MSEEHEELRAIVSQTKEALATVLKTERPQVTHVLAEQALRLLNEALGHSERGEPQRVAFVLGTAAAYIRAVRLTTDRTAGAGNPLDECLVRLAVHADSGSADVLPSGDPSWRPPGWKRMGGDA